MAKDLDGDDLLKSTPAKGSPDAKTQSNDNSYSSGTGNIDADLASCVRTMSKAKQCCGSPASCLTGADRAQYNSVMSQASTEDDGVTDVCSRMQQASTASGDINGKIGAVCTNNQYACQNTCAAMATKYQQLLDTCGENCEEYSTLRDAVSTLTSNQSACYALEAKGDAMLMQSASSQHNQDLAAYCQTNGGSSGGSGYGQQKAPDASSAANARAGGGVAAYQSNNAASATSAGTSAARGNAASAYTSLPELEVTYATGNYGPGPGAGGTPTVNTVPNGGGGGLPGTSGPVGANAAGIYRGPSPGSPGFSTDVEQGFRSGGYSAPGGAGPTDGENHPLAIGREPTSGGAGSGFEGMDLKEYLPGGSRYRRVVGAADPRNEINAKEDDIFRRISMKYQERCKLGMLYQCNNDR